MDSKKLLVISDSHGHDEKLEIALQHGKDNNINAVAFLGDDDDSDNIVEYFDSICKKIDYFPNRKVVRGNHDKPTSGPENDLLDFCRHRFFLCHGQKYRLHYTSDGYQKMHDAAKEKGADVILCGHYHDYHKKIKHNDILIIFPGSIGATHQGRSERTFVIIDCSTEKDLIVELYTINKYGEIECRIL